MATRLKWFAERRPEVTMAARAADRKRMVAALLETSDPIGAGRPADAVVLDREIHIVARSVQANPHDGPPAIRERMLKSVRDGLAGDQGYVDGAVDIEDHVVRVAHNLDAVNVGPKVTEVLAQLGEVTRCVDALHIVPILPVQEFVNASQIRGRRERDLAVTVY